MALKGCDRPPPLAQPGRAVNPSAIIVEAKDRDLMVLS
jgi:hypothetical protein